MDSELFERYRQVVVDYFVQQGAEVDVTKFSTQALQFVLEDERFAAFNDRIQTEILSRSEEILELGQTDIALIINSDFFLSMAKSHIAPKLSKENLIALIDKFYDADFLRDPAFKNFLATIDRSLYTDVRDHLFNRLMHDPDNVELLQAILRADNIWDGFDSKSIDTFIGYLNDRLDSLNDSGRRRIVGSFGVGFYMAMLRSDSYQVIEFALKSLDDPLKPLSNHGIEMVWESALDKIDTTLIDPTLAKDVPEMPELDINSGSASDHTLRIDAEIFQQLPEDLKVRVKLLKKYFEVSKTTRNLYADKFVESPKGPGNGLGSIPNSGSGPTTRRGYNPWNL